MGTRLENGDVISAMSRISLEVKWKAIESVVLSVICRTISTGIGDT